MLIVQSQSTDVYRNLAVEEWLFDHADRRGPVLFLCVNATCVVIGKNQNPWKECRLSLMEKEGVPLARRISGGGAVYHDEGNLNFGVIVPRTEYREEKQYELIFQTLEKFGIKASKLRKNSLAVDGKKFSGQAFCFRGQHVLHHGTLLANSDLNRLGRYLGPEVEDIQTKAVASVPSEVMNLSDAAPGLTVEKLSDALIETFRKMYGSGGVSSFAKASADRVECWSDADILEKIGAATQLLSSNDWKLNHTPRFQVTLNGQTLEVEKGFITNLDGNPPFGERSAV
jgi:lipoate-protein ligase A